MIYTVKINILNNFFLYILLYFSLYITTIIYYSVWFSRYLQKRLLQITEFLFYIKYIIHSRLYIYIYINILLPLMYYLYKHIAVGSVQNMWQIISQMCNEWSVKKLSKNFLIMINLKFKSNAEFDLWICVHEK